MKVKLCRLEKADHKKVVDFAIKGMHFERFLDCCLILKLYGWYFLCREMAKATQVIAAYVDGQLAGVLLAGMEREERKYASSLQKLYLGIGSIVQKCFFGGSAGEYDKANERLLEEYRRSNSPDGEILFFAVAPEFQGRHIGTVLLEELQRRENGKEVYLFTDDCCNYKFYEYKKFNRFGVKDITLHIDDKGIPIKCFLYNKVLGK